MKKPYEKPLVSKSLKLQTIVAAIAVSAPVNNGLVIGNGGSVTPD
ncbi:MAG: hypothetical protein AAFO77_02265 [Pseudomonadota bacterium]